MMHDGSSERGEHDDVVTADHDEYQAIVRQATADDAPALAGLISEFNGPQGDARETAARLSACEGQEVALVAWTPSGAAGFACLRLTQALGTREPQALLTELYVREAFRRQGIARALVAEAERLALEGGAVALYLFTGRENAEAQALYARLGYVSRSVVYQKPVTTWPAVTLAAVLRLRRCDGC